MNFCLRPKAIDVAIPSENEVPPTVRDDPALRGRAAELHRQFSKMREPVMPSRDQLVINFEFDISTPGIVKGDASTSLWPSGTYGSSSVRAEASGATKAIEPSSPSTSIQAAASCQPEAVPSASAVPADSEGNGPTEDGAAGPLQHPRGFVRVRSVRSSPPRPEVDLEPPQPQCLEVLLAAECGVRDGSGVYKTHEQRLRERLERLHLEMVIVAGDGNCQFRSISNELYSSQEHHAAIRRQAVAHIAGQRSTYSAFLGEDFDEYLTQMARCGTWGDELTLRAVCDSFGITIHVVTSDTDHWYLIYEPESRKMEREIFLTYIAPIHYNSIRRQSSLKTMALSFSRGLQRLGSTVATRTTSANRALATVSSGRQSPLIPSTPSTTTTTNADGGAGISTSRAPSDTLIPSSGPTDSST